MLCYNSKKNDDGYSYSSYHFLVVKVLSVIGTTDAYFTTLRYFVKPFSKLVFSSFRDEYLPMQKHHR